MRPGRGSRGRCRARRGRRSPARSVRAADRRSLRSRAPSPAPRGGVGQAGARGGASTTYAGPGRVSTPGGYACRALLSLAPRVDESGPTSVRDIAERTGLPQPYLEQILLALKGAGLVRSKRGVGGGYVLARPPEQILLSEILSAVDGPITLGD